MKRLLAYLFLILLSVYSINQNVVFAEAEKMVAIKGKAMVYMDTTSTSYNYKNSFKFQSPDPSLSKLLKSNSGVHFVFPKGVKTWKEYEKKIELKYGKRCFRHKVSFTYDGKQFAHFFEYKRTYSQDEMCINEVYKVSAENLSNLYGLVGVDATTGKAIGKYIDGSYSDKNGFIILTKNTLKKLCIKAASTKGVLETCYDPSDVHSKLGQIVQTRLDAIKMREEARGNIIAASEPIETSVTDTLGPKINVPGKLIAKNDQVILAGKITDENNIASVKIDNTSVTLDKKGNFEIALYVPLDGSKVSIEAIDKFANKTSRTIVISREQQESGEQIVKLPSLNPTKIDAKTNPDALALIVGITNYKNIPISIYADKDAKLFADYAYRSLGISRDKTKLLVNDSANYIEIKKSLKRWLKNEIVADKSDVYVFFAGHGLVSDNQKDLYLIPYDGETSLLTDTAFKRSNLFSLIEEANPGSITAFFDTCYSGLTRQNEMLVADARPIKIVADETSLPSNVNLISAASNNEIASSLEGAEHGMFSYYLMEGLGGNADLDQNKNITVGELHEYVKNRVKEKAAKLGRNQNPQVSGNKDKVLVKLN